MKAFPAPMPQAIPWAAFAAESTNYSITPASQASGGRSTSANYTVDVSMEVGTAATSTPYQVRAGFAGAVQDVAGFEISAAGLTVDEGNARQLESHLQMDDDSLTAVAVNDVSWSVLSGPLVSINPSGLATAGLVHQDSPAVAQGSYAGLTGTLGLTVIDAIPVQCPDGTQSTCLASHPLTRLLASLKHLNAPVKSRKLSFAADRPACYHPRIPNENCARRPVGLWCKSASWGSHMAQRDALYLEFCFRTRRAFKLHPGFPHHPAR